MTSFPPAKILVTGGAGYVGSACVRALIRAGLEAWAVDDLREGNAGAVPQGHLFVQDIRDTDALAALMARLEVDAVLHAAALASVADSFREPEAYWAVNVDGTRSVLEAMVRGGVKRLVLSSTAALYRHGVARPLREDDPLDPASPYGSTKLAAEHLARDYSRRHGLVTVALRYFNASGADPDGRHGEARAHETHAIPLLLEVALKKRPCFQVFGTDLDTRDGSCIRDYVSIPDLCDAHARALTQPFSEPYTVCNLGTGQGVSVRELLTAARRVTGVEIAHRDAPPRPGDPAFLVADNTLAARILGWQPRTSDLDTILSTAWAWHRDHPDGYADDPVPRA